MGPEGRRAAGGGQRGGRRIGVLGGTFDPPHIGHLVAAVNVRDELELDVVLLVVANVPWQKRGTRRISAPDDRFAMVEAAIEGVAGLEASRIEIDRGGSTYTVDTLEALSKSEPGSDLFLVVGGDVAAELDSWHQVERVREMATLVVVTRPGSPQPDLAGWKVQRVTIPSLAVSSTDLRRRAAEGRTLDFLVPAGAIRVIEKRHLYARTR